MGWPKRLVLVRHAESEGNVLDVDKRAQFDVSTPAHKLTERGREQAKITGKYLHDTFGGFDVYYVSYYTRSKETMEIMYPEVPKEYFYEDPRLAESQRSSWHVLTNEQIEERHPEEVIRRNREGFYHYRPFGGENWPDVELRIHSFLGTLSRDYEDQYVLMVVPGNWLTLFQRLVHHFSIEEAIQKYRKGVWGNASVTVYEGKKDFEKGKSRLALKQENFIPWKGKL